MTKSLTRSAMVVPCFNEAARLDGEMLRALAATAQCDIIAVDDGSSDSTAEMLDALAAADDRIRVIRQGRNQGKGEAVRAGLVAATAEGYDYVGFCDADFATPVVELSRLLQICRHGKLVVVGSRVALLGHQIDRSLARHYTGRVFGTLSSLVLGFQIYDTQCGAKVFKAGPALQSAVATPFTSRWAFDVELLGRLAHQHRGTSGFLEVPLVRWHDVAGSKLSLTASLRSTADLLRIRRALRSHRRLMPAG